MLKKSVAILCALSLVFSQCIILGVSAKADKTAPTFKSSTPKNNQTGISTTAKITLKFSENIYKGKTFTKIKLTKSGKAVTLKMSISKTTLTITHKAAFAYKSSYVLSIPASSVKDKAGNALKKTKTIKFKTKAKVKVPVEKTYIVGTDIPAGEYVITGSAKTYWYVSSSPDIMGYLTGSGENMYITVDDGTYLTVVDGTVIPIAEAPVFASVNGKFSDGMYKIGRDLAAGEYDVTAISNADMTGYAILKDSYDVQESYIGTPVMFTSGSKHITVTDGQYIMLVGAYILAAVG
ncbi:MAG: Ig-like domain-containing protein [Clostridia bacterium]|jgi:methionine-rich copper-binding protein CopC